MKVIEMDPEDFFQKQRNVHNFVVNVEPTQEDINESEQMLVSEMLNIGLIVSGIKNGGLFALDVMTPDIRKKYKEMGYYLHRVTIRPGFVLVMFSRKDPKIRDWKDHTKVGEFLSFLTPGDLEEIVKVPSDHKYGVGIEVYYRYKGGKMRKAFAMNQIAVGKTKKEIEEYLQPFVDALKIMPTPKELEIVKVVPKISR